MKTVLLKTHSIVVNCLREKKEKVATFKNKTYTKGFYLKGTQQEDKLSNDNIVFVQEKCHQQSLDGPIYQPNKGITNQILLVYYRL